MTPGVEIVKGSCGGPRAITLLSLGFEAIVVLALGVFKESGMEEKKEKETIRQ